MLKKRLSLVLLSSLVLASCGGGGGSAIAPATAPPKAPAATTTVPIALILPNASTSHIVRRPKYVSPATLGATISVTGSHGGTGSAVVDLSIGSSACTGTGAQRACSVNVVVPIDIDTFTITLYDAAPVNGVIPATAHVLGVGTVTQSVTSTFSSTISVAVGATISNIGLSGTYVSVPANGHSATTAIVINPTDFGNNPLSGSTTPYANPIAVALTEAGGSGHMQLLLNGTPSGTGATLTRPTDTLGVLYDGLGSAGYSSAIVLAASGATSQSLRISPMYVTSTSAYFSNGTAMLSGTGLAVPLSITETNAPASVTYTATAAAGCSGIASLGALVGSGPSASLSITGGTTAASTGCSISIADNVGTSMQLPVINSPTGATVPLPGASIQEYTISAPPNPPASPQAIAAGPDGRIWVGDVLNNTYWGITTSGVATQFGSAQHFGVGGLTASSDGNLWAADSNNVTIDKINPANGTTLNSWGTSYTPYYIASGSDGNVWFTEDGGGTFSYIGSYSPGGVLTEYLLPVVFSVTTATPKGLAANPAGGLWLCDDVNTGTPRVDAVSYAGVGSTITLLPFDCSTIAFQPDGKAAWATAIGSNSVYRIDATTHQLTTIALSEAPAQIVAGADGAMYVSESGTQGIIGRIGETAPYALSEVPVPTAGAIPTGIALGADGRIWFGENSQNKIGALTP